MLEGLEVSEEKFSNSILNNKYSGRFEAEFFHKKYKQIFKDLTNKEFEELGKLVFLTDGEHGNAITFPEGFAKYYGARNVLSGILDENNVEYITEEHHYKIRKSKLYPNDILISCVGANIGYASIVPDYVGEANIVRNVALIRTTDKRILNHYLLSYFQSKYGKGLFIRMATGNAQPLVSLDYIKTIPVFIPSLDFQKEIKRVVEKAKKSLVESALEYTEAENILLQELGLSNWQPNIKNNNTKSLKESFLSNGRIDAEYYQPKYDEIEKKIKEYKNGVDTVANNFKLIKTEIEFTRDKYLYLEIGDVNVSNGNISPNYVDTEALPANAKINVEMGDVLVSKVRPYRGAVTFIDKKYDDLIVSGAFTVLREKSSIKKETLCTLLKTNVYKELMMKFNVGSSYPVIRDEDILNLPIPKIPESTQESISDKVKQSFSLLSKSNQLLEAAKKAVEIAIEENEESALNYLNNY